MALALAGCGWHAGLTPPAKLKARTIGVEVVTRAADVLERDLEPEFSDALSRAVSDLVGLPLERPSRADLIVRGEITGYRRRGGVRSVQNQLLETAIQVEVKASLLDRRRGTIEKEAFEGAWTGYAVGNPAEEQGAQERSLRYLAETLVLELFQQGPKIDQNLGESPE